MGDRTFTFVKVPGHTPGMVAIIFPVTVDGVPHIAANWTGGLPNQVKAAQAFADSVAKFKMVTAKAHADIAISDHAGSDLKLLADYAKAPPGTKHPLVIGEENYQDLPNIEWGVRERDGQPVEGESEVVMRIATARNRRTWSINVL